MLYFSPFFEATKLEGDKVVCQLNSATTWLCVIYNDNCDWIWAELIVGSSSTIVLFANIVNIRLELKNEKEKKNYPPPPLYPHTHTFFVVQASSFFCLSYFSLFIIIYSLRNLAKNIQ